MQSSASIIVKDVVLAGAGHAHVAVLRSFGMAPLPGVRLTLVTREVDTPYSGMLPGLVAGHYSFDEAHIDCGPLAHFAGARLVKAQACGIKVASKLLICDGRPPLPYDILSLDIGSQPATGDVPGAAGHAIAVKPIDQFLRQFETLRSRVLARAGPVRIALVGGGAGGVELILAVERRLRTDCAAQGRDASALSFSLVESAPAILAAFAPGVARRFLAILQTRGITVVTGARVARVDAHALHCADGRTLPADEILWTTQAAPAAWLADTGLTCDAQGFLRVDARLNALGHPDIFAAGDTVAFEPRPLPKSGVYAVRAGPVLAANIRARLTGAPLRKFTPQHQTLALISTGEKYAVGARNGLSFGGAWVWRWKDRIDRAFMRRFADLPQMAAPRPPASPLADVDLAALSASAMRCGGCGAKVGAPVLSRALRSLQPFPRASVLSGLSAPDDAAMIERPDGSIALHSVDYFRAMIDDPYLFGRIAANHALSDIFACGGQAETALAIATLPYGLAAKVEADLATLMQGANEALRAAGCTLVGGHTSEGAELALGFSVNGSVLPQNLLRKSGLMPGDALILTKPLGTGALFAAQTQGKAKARWIAAAVEQMLVSNQSAAQVLAAHGAQAATDVTGFGLAGHLAEMTKASGVSAQLWLAEVPVLPGARAVMALGIVSTMQAENLQLASVLGNDPPPASDAAAAILFDPQTSGGLLAGVPAASAGACLAALRAAGLAQAAVIGRVEARKADAQPGEAASITLCAGPP